MSATIGSRRAGGGVGIQVQVEQRLRHHQRNWAVTKNEKLLPNVQCKLCPVYMDTSIARFNSHKDLHKMGGT